MSVELVLIVTVWLNATNWVSFPYIYGEYSSMEKCELTRNNPTEEMNQWALEKINEHERNGYYVDPNLSGGLCREKE